MIRGLLGVLLVAAALAASVSVAGPPAGTLRLCADPDNLPFSSATGPERGFYLDVGALVAARLGMTVDVVWWRTFYGHRAVRNTLLAEACDAYVGLPYAAGYMDAKVSVTRPFLDVGYAIMAPRSLAFARLDDLKPHRLAVEFRTPPQSLMATKEGFSVSRFDPRRKRSRPLHGTRSTWRSCGDRSRAISTSRNSPARIASSPSRARACSGASASASARVTRRSGGGSTTRWANSSPRSGVRPSTTAFRSPPPSTSPRRRRRRRRCRRPTPSPPAGPSSTSTARTATRRTRTVPSRPAI